MYIEKIKIDKFRVLEDIEIHFQPPGGATADPETGNVVNVIAGVNGTGKTTILNFIHDCLFNPYEFTAIKKYGDAFLGDIVLENDKIDYHWRVNSNYRDQMRQYEGMSDVSSHSRLIYLPAQLFFNYQGVSFDSAEYKYINVINANNILGNAETYIKEFVFAKERSSMLSDPKKRASFAVEEFNSKFLNMHILTRLLDLDAARLNRPVFENSKGDKVTIDQLSDGEKQLYGRVIALMILNPSNSIILIDEPEIALHPAWQQKIMQIYSRIGKNNQFIVATHSPQIIASVPYKNRILLRKENGKIQPVHMNQPPSGVDVNSILSEIMGADPRPPELLKLYAQYRKLVEEKKENTPEALAVKAQLSEESDHSRFMQEMAFLIELRDAI